MSPSTLTTVVHAEVRVLPGGRSLLTTPADNSYTLDIDAQTLLRMLDAWATNTSSPLLPTDWHDGAAILRDVLDRDGALTDPDPAGVLPKTPPRYDDGDGSDAAPGDLLVTGDPEVIAALQHSSDRVIRAVPADDWQRVVHRAFRTGELLVYAVRGADEASLIALDRLCCDARTPWVAVEVTRSSVWVGPFVTPGIGANYEDFADRRTAAAFDAAAHRAPRASRSRRGRRRGPPTPPVRHEHASRSAPPLGISTG